jgi:hypothetical protein
MSDDTDSSMKYVIFRKGPSRTSDTAPMVLYDSVNVDKVHSGKKDEIFRVYSNLKETERLFRESEGGPVQYMKIVRQPSMELATLPPPRSNILYLITEYEIIRDPVFTMLADRDIQVYMRQDDDFKKIKESLTSMTAYFNQKLQSGERGDVLNMIGVGVNISDSYVFSPASTEDIEKPISLSASAKIRGFSELLKDIKSRSPEWKIVLDVHNQLSAANFTDKGLNVASKQLSLEPSTVS